jgi:hypothetical protein
VIGEVKSGYSVVAKVSRFCIFTLEKMAICELGEVISSG